MRREKPRDWGDLGEQFRRGPGHRMRQVPWAKVAERLRNGESLADLAQEYGRHPSVMRTRLNQRGWHVSGFTAAEAAEMARVAEENRRKGQRRPLFLGFTAPAFMDEGACRTADPNLFYNDENERGLVGHRKSDRAKAVCAGCPVVMECLGWAMATDEPHGVWGGMTSRERHRLRNQAAS
jgi:WhiB family transcriptional regulator, redox-sensing transcriptional regulator